MSEQVDEIDIESLNALIERVNHAIEHDLALSVDDLKLLLSAIITLSTLQQKIEQDGITLHKLRKLLGMVQKSEKRRKKQSDDSQDSADEKDSDKKNDQKKNKAKKKRAPKKRNPPPVVHHAITQYSRGQCCPGCGRGKLYKHEPRTLLRITGHMPYEAVQHVREQLRCNGCQGIYTASLPKEVAEDGGENQKYGYSARTLMVISKFFSGLPYYHQGVLGDTFGINLSASTVFDQCEHVANSCMPIFYEMKRQAGNAYQFLLDDTHNKILTQKPEMRDTPNGKGKRLRTGIYSSGLIARKTDGKEIVLFETSLGHAGEHLTDILKKRDKNLPIPLVMSDALSSNQVAKQPLCHAFCNAHARRQFIDLEKLYPKDINWVLDTYGKIWKNERDIKDNGLNDQARLEYHKTHSLPAMESIKEWALKRKQSKTFEQHAALGKAINYFLRHYDRLILFCIEHGALIDNNAMEEKLKIVIRGRKTAHFYKTAVGAGVANVLISILATAHSAEVNVYNYFLALQQNQEAVKENPCQWMPWNYTEALNLPAEEVPPDKMAA